MHSHEAAAGNLKIEPYLRQFAAKKCKSHKEKTLRFFVTLCGHQFSKAADGRSGTLIVKAAVNAPQSKRFADFGSAHSSRASTWSAVALAPLLEWAHDAVRSTKSAIGNSAREGCTRARARRPCDGRKHSSATHHTARGDKYTISWPRPLFDPFWDRSKTKPGVQGRGFYRAEDEEREGFRLLRHGADAPEIVRSRVRCAGEGCHTEYVG